MVVGMLRHAHSYGEQHGELEHWQIRVESHQCGCHPVLSCCHDATLSAAYSRRDMGFKFVKV